MGILETIIAERRKEIEQMKAERPLRTLEARFPAGPRYSFQGALSYHGVNIIAEIKQKSPSKGLLTDAFDPVVQAAQYRSAGAAALSVLTEEAHFGGRHEYIELAKRTAQLPTLCKDFIIDPYQISYARYMNADAILLIVRILTRDALVNYLRVSEELGMDSLVEAHNAEEIKIAVDAGAAAIGINSRDLSSFEVDIDGVGGLASLIPDGISKVAESGITCAEDIRKLRSAGFSAFLVGEVLMRSSAPAKLLEELRSV